MANNIPKIPCFLCNTICHFTENCDVYVTEESRQQIFRLKNCCSQCINPPNLYKANEKYYAHCEFHRKCYICFATDHNTLNCPEQSTVSKLFSPKLDQNLLPRFIQLFELEEKFFLCFKFPVVFNCINIKPLKVTYEKNLTVSNVEAFRDSDLVISNLEKFQGSDLVVAEKITFQFQRIDLSPLKHTTFWIRHLQLFLIEILFNEFLQLLSSKTKVLGCENAKLLPNFILSEILKTAPYLEELSLPLNDKSWPKDILRLNRSTKMKSINLKVSNFNFNIHGLANLMRVKSVKVFLCMHISLDYPSDKALVIEMVKDKLSKYFVLEEEDRFSRHKLIINLKLQIGNKTTDSEHVYFDLKH